MSKKAYPASAFRFLAPAAIEPMMDAQAQGPRRFSGIAYSGEPITDHGYFGGPIVFDLATLSCDTPAPLLEGHDPDDTIGVIDQASIDSGLSISGSIFSHIDDDAAMIAAKADAGFPWQLSVGIFPGVIEEVQAGATANYNGRSFTGPLTVFKNARVREVSFCALGADPLTSARVFSAGDSIDIETTETGMTESTQEPEEITDGQESQAPEAAEEVLTETESPEIIELKAQLAEARSQLAEFRMVQRKEKVLALFASLHRDVTDAAIAPYLDMSEATFGAIAADMTSLKPKPPGHLFAAIATGPGADDSAPRTFAAIAADGLRQLQQGKQA